MMIALINGCLICQSVRVCRRPDALDVDPRDVQPAEDFYAAVANWRASEVFDEQERLTLEYAERIAEDPQNLPFDDEFWGRLHAVFEDPDIVNLTYGITTWIATGRFIHVLGADDACPV